jgi:hypothetical protein
VLIILASATLRPFLVSVGLRNVHILTVPVIEESLTEAVDAVPEPVLELVLEVDPELEQAAMDAIRVAVVNSAAILVTKPFFILILLKLF